VDFLAQVVNTRRGIGLDVEDVEMWKVCQALQDADPIKATLEHLHPPVRGKPCPADPYCDEGQHFRILVFRNRVCHHGQNPFWLRLGAELRAHLLVGPRVYELGRSRKPAIDELQDFWTLVNAKCDHVLELL